MASDCPLCRWANGHHDAACPEEAHIGDRPGLRIIYSNGYESGRSGRTLLDRANRTFRLGWTHGVIALEAYENGHDPRFED